MKSVVVLHLLVFAACGFVFSSCDDSDPVAAQQDGVFLVASKPVYRQGDEIEVFLINATDNAKVISSCGKISVTLFQRSGDQWYNVSGMCTEFPSQSASVAAWGKLKLSAGVNVGHPAGEYRVGADLCEEGGEGCVSVYSESFQMFAER